MARVTLNLSRLVAEGSLTQTEADRLATLAEASGRGGLIINLLSILGALAVSAGVIALAPSPEVGLGLAALAIGAGAWLYFGQSSDWRVLAHGLVCMGVLGVCGWIGVRLGEASPLGASFAVFLALAGAAILFRQGFLAALAPIALGGAIGSGTGYWTATYSIFVRECLVTILVFSGVAAGLYWARGRLAETWSGVTTIAARVSFFLVNFGFWVGSLWGDYPFRLWTSPEDSWWSSPSEGALHVPDWAFSIGWAVFLGVCIWLGTRDHRRFLANTAVTFLAIHAYTQFFEVLGAHPWTLILGGLSMVGVAGGIARFDAWNRRRAKGGAPPSPLPDPA
jgi:iron complex transport system permease protein